MNRRLMLGSAPLVLVSALVVIAALPFASPAVAATQMTTITMSVTGCEGCVIVPATTPAGATDIYNGPRTKVRNGVATIVVPTAQTAGMYFGIEPSWKSMINAQPLIVFQYKGAAGGGTVTRAEAMSYKKASACWAGTTNSSTSLEVVVRRVWMPAFNPGKPASRTQVPLAWVVPTQKALAPFWPSVKGVLAVQNTVDCRLRQTLS